MKYVINTFDFSFKDGCISCRLRGYVDSVYELMTRCFLSLSADLQTKIMSFAGNNVLSRQYCLPPKWQRFFVLNPNAAATMRCAAMKDKEWRACSMELYTSVLPDLHDPSDEIIFTNHSRVTIGDLCGLCGLYFWEEGEGSPVRHEIMVVEALLHNRVRRLPNTQSNRDWIEANMQWERKMCCRMCRYAANPHPHLMVSALMMISGQTNIPPEQLEINWEDGSIQHGEDTLGMRTPYGGFHFYPSFFSHSDFGISRQQAQDLLESVGW